MSSSTKIDNRKKDISIPGKDRTQELEHTLSAEKMNSINFKKKKCLTLHYNIQNSYLLIAPKLLNLNQKILKFFHIHYA